MLSKKIVLAISLIVLAGLSGCSGTNVYVLEREELIRVQANETITSTYKGWLLSDRAVKRVMDAKIKDANLK